MLRAIVTCVLLFASAAGAAELPPLDASVDPRLRPNVEFWVRIYSQLYTYEGVIHDAKYLDKVYEVLDLRRGGGQAGRSKRRWRDVLLSVHRKQFQPETLNQEERRVFEMYRDVDEPNKFLNAAHRKRLRFQLGQRDRFIQGIRFSGRYLPWMEEIFRREGMPPELTRLPFVESSFDLRARSKVGASGIWQFMRSTGKLFLRVDDSVDERNDPIRATEAAAKLLKMNYESLGSWALAVTAYNHGRKGIMRAVRRVGSNELGDLLWSYRSRGFGFASSNFYSGLLAAIEVERNAERYFGPVIREPKLAFYEVELPEPVEFRELARFMRLNSSVVREYNPGLTDAVHGGEYLVPQGYRLRLPLPASVTAESAARVFLAGYAEIPAIFKGQRRASYGRKSRVR